MWLWLRRTLGPLWRNVQGAAGERRTLEARSRFWAGVREGQQEADSSKRSSEADETHSARLARSNR
jgi:hypothetical protein